MQLNRTLLLGGLFLAVSGSLISLYNMLGWYLTQYEILIAQNEVLVYMFYFVELFLIMIVLLGLYMVYFYFKSQRPDYTLGGIVSLSLTRRNSVKLLLFSSLVYCLVYLFFSGVIVPVSAQELSYYNSLVYVEECCGQLGTVPKVILIIKALSVGVILVPVNITLTPIISFLVGLNLTISSLSFNYARSVSSRHLLFFLGSLAGLFTSCPTCAALFIAEAIGGIGVASISLTLSSYQLYFIIISLPLLVLSCILTPYAILRSSSYCRLGRK